MPLFDCSDDENAARVECAICLGVWVKPVEVRPCGHIFCGACLGVLRQCPECRADVTGADAPNRLLLNIVAGLRGRCQECGWKGTKEQFDHSHADACPGAGSAEPDLGAIFGVPADDARMREVPAESRTGEEVATDIVAQSSSEFEAQMRRALEESMQHCMQHSAAGAAGGPSTHATAGRATHGDGSSAPQPGASPGARLPSTLFDDTPPWVEYGLDKDDFDTLCMLFTSLRNDSNNGKLGRDDVRRFLMLSNLPSNDAVIGELFNMFGEDEQSSNAGLTFHQLCVWLPSHQRDPQREYNLGRDTYRLLHAEYCRLDAARKGFLDDEEARQFLLFMRTNGATTAMWDAVADAVAASRARHRCYPAGALLHDLLVTAASCNDGWDVCELDEQTRKEMLNPTDCHRSASHFQQPPQSQPRRPHSQTLQPRTSQRMPPAPPQASPPQPYSYSYQQQQPVYGHVAQPAPYAAGAYPAMPGYGAPHLGYPPPNGPQPQRIGYPSPGGYPPPQPHFATPGYAPPGYAPMQPQYPPPPPQSGPPPSSTSRRKRTQSCKHQ